MSENIRIAVVDDHPFFRDGVQRALSRVTDIKLIAMGKCADDAVTIARDHKPDVMLLDISMPGGGVQAASRIIASGVATKVVMLTASDDDDTVASALAAGVHGYMTKGIDTDDLVDGIRTVHLGQAYITPELSSRLLVQRLRGVGTVDRLTTTPALNFREQQILDCAAQGMTNVEIARKLGIAVPTAKNYMSRIFEKMNVRNRAEAIAMKFNTEHKALSRR
jgi:two-component system, NarL family, nitrate/nitrite response regulator NarL